MAKDLVQFAREEIKEKLMVHYTGRADSDDNEPIERSLLESAVKDATGKTVAQLFVLSGSPPKGYALYIPDRCSLCFCGM